MALKVMANTSLSEQLLSRIELRTAPVAVIGLGYVGLPLAETFAAGGYPVVGFDIDPEKVKKLQTGHSYIRHIASERIVDLLRSGRFEATTNPACFKDVDAIVICVPTPLTEAREPDLSYIVSTGEAIRPHLRRGHLVVLESSTFPGTTEEVLRPILEQSGLRAGKDFFLAYSPEREDPGNAQFSTRNIPKVVGGIDAASRDLAVALYEPVVEGVIPVSSATKARGGKPFFLGWYYRPVFLRMDSSKSIHDGTRKMVIYSCAW
jgi:UDP-N-acetyl-D-glucosamine dehydrogenase